MPGRLVRAARLYGRLQLVQLRTYLEYEADFWIGIAGVALTHGVGGWSATRGRATERRPFSRWIDAAKGRTNG